MPRGYPRGAKGFSPFRDLVGVTFTKVDSGYSHCVLEVDKRLLNPAGIVHGGANGSQGSGHIFDLQR
jgi:acyl-coenzyme A thioesterase PaaI-like protein